MARSILSDQDYGSIARLLNLPAPASDNEPARLADLKAAIEGLNWKDNVRVASTANINLASPGSSIDGVALSANDRVLAKNQTTASENGIYIWNGASTAMTRSLDANTSDELESAVVTVDEGTSNSGTSWRQTLVNFTIGSGSITWATFGTAAGAATESSAGIAEIATQTETDTGTDDARFITALKLANWAGRKLKYTTNVGDGSATSYTITHNLGTRDVIVSFFRNSGNYDEAIPDVQHSTTNTLTLVFASAPASAAWRVVVIG